MKRPMNYAHSFMRRLKDSTGVLMIHQKISSSEKDGIEKKD
jgi:hypothetical protein